MECNFVHMIVGLCPTPHPPRRPTISQDSTHHTFMVSFGGIARSIDLLMNISPHYQQERIRMATIRACNYVKIETGQNFPASTKNSNMHCTGCVKC